VQIFTYEDVSVCNLSPNFSCFIWTTTFPHKCVAYKTSPCACLHTTRRVYAHFLTCVTFNTWHHLFHLTTHICSRNDVPPHDFNLRTLLCIQLLTHETMSENIGFTDSKNSVHCKKTCLYATFWLNIMRVQILTHEPMSVCSFEHNFPLLRLMWHVSTSFINCETWQCAIFTKRRFSALFWLTRTSPGANFHIGGRVCMQLFTYEIMSDLIGLTHATDCDVYSLRKTSLCATVWLTWTGPHANFLMRGRVCIQHVP